MPRQPEKITVQSLAGMHSWQLVMKREFMVVDHQYIKLALLDEP
jgi:hypothetical protein